MKHPNEVEENIVTEVKMPNKNWLKTRQNGLALLLSLVLCVSHVTIVTGTDMETFLGAPVWYLDFEVSFKVRFTDSTQDGPTKNKTTISVDRVYSASWPLDIRMDGLSQVLNSSALAGGADGSVPTMAEQQRMMEEMMARMNNAANWMSSGGAANIPDNATDEEMQAATEAGMNAAMGPGSFEYLRIDSGWNLVNEMGERFDQTIRTIQAGQGTVWPGGGMSITFEIDGVSKKYQLVIPQGFNDMHAKMRQKVVMEQGHFGQMHVASRDSSELGLAFYPKDLTIDDPKSMQAGMALMRGDVDLASGKVVGERTIAAHYIDNGVTSVPGTLTFRYTLSMTKPSRK